MLGCRGGIGLGLGGAHRELGRVGRASGPAALLGRGEWRDRTGFAQRLGRGKVLGWLRGPKGGGERKIRGKTSPREEKREKKFFFLRASEI